MQKMSYNKAMRWCLSDSDFEMMMQDIINMELNERCSSQDTSVEESLMLYATQTQWNKYPLLKKMIMGDGLSNKQFKIAIGGFHESR